MKKKAIQTDLNREIIKNKGRFLSLILIVALGTAFFSGIRATQPNMQETLDHYYDETNFYDLRILSKTGITEDDLKMLQEVDGVQQVEGVYSTDALCELEDTEYVIQIQSITSDINQIAEIEGRLPQNDGECLVDKVFLENTGLIIGDKIHINTGENTILQNDELTIVGFGNRSEYLSWDRGASSLGDGKLDGFIMVNSNEFLIPVFTQAYITIDGMKDLNTFSKEYEVGVDEVQDNIDSIQSSAWYVLDRNTNTSYVEYNQDAQRIGNIGKVFPLIFFLVATLVCLTNMTRMVEEQRTQIGTMKALGYSNLSVASKYMKYAFMATMLGSILGVAVGEQIFPRVIMTAYGLLYQTIPRYYVQWQFSYAIIAVLVAVMCTLFATFVACYKEALSSPAVLMRPTTPKYGKKIPLERITFLWKRLSFTKKSTIRNLIRYKKRLFMTIFGIGSCMGLLLVGFGLKDSIFQIAKLQYSEIFNYNAAVTIASNVDSDTISEYESEIASMDGVEDITTIHTKTATIGNGTIEKDITMLVPMEVDNIQKFLNLRNRITKETLEFSDTGAVLSEKVANQLDVQVGDEIYLKLEDGSRVSVKINGISENYIYHYLFMSPELYQTIYQKEPAVTTYFINTNNQTTAYEEEFSQKILKSPVCTGISLISELNHKLDDMLGTFDIVIRILTISAGLLAFVVLFNLNSINITERRRELASLKVLGFYDLEVANYVFRENVILTIFGIILGLFIGNGLHLFIVKTVEIDMMMFGRTIDISSYIIASVMTLIFSIIINCLMYFSLRKIDMIESMKYVE